MPSLLGTSTLNVSPDRVPNLFRPALKLTPIVDPFTVPETGIEWVLVDWLGGAPDSVTRVIVPSSIPPVGLHWMSAALPVPVATYSFPTDGDPE